MTKQELVKMARLTYTLYDWDDGSERKVVIKFDEDAYRVNVEGELWGFFDTMKEVEKEIIKMMRLYCWHLVPQNL